MSDADRPERRTETLADGAVVVEPEDCRFVSSPSGTVHERDACDGEDYEYAYHPRCGQRLPDGSLWGRVDAETPAEAVLKYDLKPCRKCVTQSGRLNQFRAAIHSNLASSTPADVPDDVLQDADLEQYIDVSGGETDG
ncbi:hypothetical protein [Halobiforma nitratireducens]|uniref:Uncharacterized protein n=1 Tax=Halobiforma nitratireducens JCM 10879 TaxID=1227454 RepID=M0LLY8_9EURY|nr:hypothetical protein [Halobiforma nitratireducens]EMA34118.1 hypothetical protein C446_13554 [Halobiforma nitratireducens JCM 10879]